MSEGGGREGSGPHIWIIHYLCARPHFYELLTLLKKTSANTVHPHFEIDGNFRTLESFIGEIPSAFPSAELFYTGKRNTLRLFSTECGEVVVKKFKLPAFPWRWFLSPEKGYKARKAYFNALHLAAIGIDTPSPVGYLIEERGGRISSEYYISLRQDSKCVAEEIHPDGAVDLTLCRAVARFLVSLHSRGVYYGDLTLANILFRKDGDSFSFSMVDTDRCVFRNPLEKWYCLRDLRRMTRDMEVHRIMVEYYASFRGWDPSRTLRQVNFLKFFHELRKKVHFASRKLRDTFLSK